MEEINNFINEANDILWSYLIIAMLLCSALFFTWRTHFVQFRNIKEMIRLLADTPTDNKVKETHVSSFQAFVISIAGRVGTGNLAGVATAITVGGAGAVFWMWIIAVIGSANAFIESTLAQLYKRKGKESFIGGPAYYMQYGLKKRWMGVCFAILISITFGFAFNSVQSNTVCAAWERAFSIHHVWMGIIITSATITVIFGGIRRIAVVSSFIVPIMAIGYVLLALCIVLYNINELPGILKNIISNAFGFEQIASGSAGAVLTQGIKRGLFSNEAGMGSAPNVAATASVTHPVKQGLIQALGVFTDTLIICTCTAFIILFDNNEYSNSLNGIQLTQAALEQEIGDIGGIFIAIAIMLFAFSSIIGNYYYGETNIRFISSSPVVLFLYRMSVAAMVMTGSVISMDLAWNIADMTMGLMTIFNLTAILLLSNRAIWLLDNYNSQKKRGKIDPVFRKSDMPQKMCEGIKEWK